MKRFFTIFRTKLTVPRVIPRVPSLAPTELALYTHRLHFVHLGDTLPQVFSKLAAVVLVARVERGQAAAVHAARESNAERVVCKYLVFRMKIIYFLWLCKKKSRQYIALIYSERRTHL